MKSFAGYAESLFFMRSMLQSGVTKQNKGDNLMKNPHFFKRLLCVILVMALLAGDVVPGLAHAVEKVTDGNVSFTQVDNSQVSAGLIPNGKTEIGSETTYADTDIVRASIILSRSSTIDAGYSAMDITGNKSAMDYRESLKKDQNYIVNQIEKAIKVDLDVIWNLTLAANMISVNVPYGQIEAIKKMSGVKDVVLENQYQPCKTKDGTAVAPNMATSGGQIGTGPVWEAGYTGAGMRIAVIDTGIDTDHQSMNPVAFEYALEQLAKKAGMTKAAYIDSLDLLDAQEIASVADKLNVKIDAQSTYINSKIAYAYNYRDFDYDVTHDNDEEGDHGSHVAGIATANSWLYNSASGNYGKALEYAFMQGVAPEAQLLALKVFGPMIPTSSPPLRTPSSWAPMPSTFLWAPPPPAVATIPTPSSSRSWTTSQSPVLWFPSLPVTPVPGRIPPKTATSTTPISA